MNIQPGKTRALWFNGDQQIPVTLISRPNDKGRVCIRTDENTRHVVHLMLLQFSGVRSEHHGTPKNQKAQQQPKPQGGISGSALLVIVIIIGWLAWILTPEKATANEIDWEWTSDYSTAIERCGARTIGEPYQILSASQEYNCMLHNGFQQVVHDGQLVGWNDLHGNQYFGVEAIYE